MSWKKLGQLFYPNQNHSWMNSHAANPYGVFISENLMRVFFTCRDTLQRSHIASLVLDLQSMKILEIDSKPLLEPGQLGLFDDSGVAVACVLEMDNYEYLYYLGWNLKVTVPWLNSIGLAKRKKTIENSPFEKVSLAPIMDRSNEDPFSISYPSILQENNEFRMWYGSNLNWGKDQSEMQHVIKYATSLDGINWIRNNVISIPLIHKNEYALSKPHVIKEDNLYKMWYSFRANNSIQTYRIGYAESEEGLKWERMDDKVGIDVSESGWDSEMICYPFVFSHKGSKYMLYNGNGYGKTGFGIAKWKE